MTDTHEGRIAALEAARSATEANVARFWQKDWVEVVGRIANIEMALAPLHPIPPIVADHESRLRGLEALKYKGMALCFIGAMLGGSSLDLLHQLTKG